MKKFFVNSWYIIFLLFFFTGCFFDKSEKVILNCADSSYSKTLVDNFNRNFYIDSITLSMWIDGTFTPNNILSDKIIEFKKTGSSLSEINYWLRELKTSEVNSSNKDIIDFLIKEKNKVNKKQDDLLKLEITDKLKDNLYELEFMECEKERNEAIKTFDLKWEKPKFYRAVFR